MLFSEDNTAGKVIALHIADPDSIPSTKHVPRCKT